MPSGNMLVDRHEDEDKPGVAGMCLECYHTLCRCSEYKEARQKEIESYCPSFEDFLVEKHAAQYCGLDDDMPDRCDSWIAGLDTNDLQKLAEEYGLECFRAGQKVGK